MCTPLANLTPMVEVLPPTRSRKSRAMRFYRNTAQHGYSADHVMVIEEKGRGTEAYGVSEIPGNEHGRAFLCGKPNAPAPYCVVISVTGEWDDCDCAGGSYRRAGVGVCRHVTALRAALANGWLEPEAADYPAAWDDGYTDADLEAMAAEYAEDERLGRFGCVRVAV